METYSLFLLFIFLPFSGSIKYFVRWYPYRISSIVFMQLMWRRFKTQRPEQHGRHLAVRPFNLYSFELYRCMMTSSNGSIFRVTGPLCGVTSEFLHKSQWRGALTFSLICVWTNGWVNNRDAGGVRRHGVDYDVTEMVFGIPIYLECVTRIQVAQKPHWLR